MSPKAEKSSRHHYRMPMKNGKFYVVLLAGGPQDVCRELRNRLMKSRNILVAYHRSYDKPKQWDRPIPPDVDFVIGLTDMFGSHAMSGKLKELCKRQGVRVVTTSSKWSTLGIALANYGILKSPPLPLNITSTAIMKTEQDEVESEPGKFAEEMAKVAESAGISKGELKTAIMEQIAEKRGVAVEHIAEPLRPTVNITVSATPGGSIVERRPGNPSPETMVLISALFQKAQDDQINVMITPAGITIEPSK